MWRISLDMTTVFHTWLDGRFIQKYHNLKRKKIDKTKHVFYFPKGKSSSLDQGMALPLPLLLKLLRQCKNQVPI